ncbi:hypothetical protein Q9Q95_09475 [Sphingomonas sp. DG1-23]|uniref:hypothetical protein n=1 Tax=Sphingomonas sp. DG1-23 TaxID=3068316 RepID=UPI00274014F8|nr:hypothetical protein [Sphingomonas sp. DG1-23]MDP5279154.1 hypothetical protein [Sphingomonas sp. DG1-23]
MAYHLGKAMAAVAALSLAATPAVAAQGPASKLSLRASTATEKESDLAGAPIIAIIGVAAIVAGGVIIATDDDDPDSP